MKGFEFDEENHIYKLDGVVIPSVSEIIRPIHEKVYGDINLHTLKTAADRGTRVHRAIEFWNKYGFQNVDEDCKGYFDAYIKFRNEHPNWKLLNSELRTYHKNLLYAMTIDEVYQTENGIVINDIKTTSQTHLDVWSVQLGGYKAGYETHLAVGQAANEELLQIKSPMPALKPEYNRVSFTTILQLFNNGKYSLYEVKDNYFMFLACLQIYKFNERSDYSE